MFPMTSALICGLALLAPQETPKPNFDAFASKMKNGGMIFTDIEGFFELQYTISGAAKRNQKAYIRKSVEEFRSLKAMEVFSLVWESDKAATSSFLMETLQRSFALGGLIYELPSEKQKLYRIRYRTTISPDTPVEQIKEIVDIVASTADDLERKFNPEGADKF
jgi:hypothetical protein